MKKGSSARKCGRCNRIVFWTVPSGDPILGLVQVCDVKNVLEHRYVRKKGEQYGHYYCMDCLKVLYPGEF